MIKALFVISLSAPQDRIIQLPNGDIRREIVKEKLEVGKWPLVEME